MSNRKSHWIFWSTMLAFSSLRMQRLRMAYRFGHGLLLSCWVQNPKHLFLLTSVYFMTYPHQHLHFGLYIPCPCPRLSSNMCIMGHRSELVHCMQVTMQTNYYGPMALQHLLLPKLKESKPSRVVWTSSGLESVGSLPDLNDWDALE